MRKLPIYILLDTSGSMRGQPIQAVDSGMKALFSALRRDPHALDSAHVCVITFDREARVLLPMTEVSKAEMPAIPPLESSPTNLGEALELMCQLTEKDVIKTTSEVKGDWLPMAVVMTDGSPSDTQLFETMAKALRDGRYRFSRIIGCAAGPKAKSDKLKMFATDVVILDMMDSNSFEKFFGWVSQSVGKHSQSTDLSLDQLPDPPQEIRIVI